MTPAEYAALVAPLPPGQRRVALALALGPRAPTYHELAAGLGLHVGSVYRHLGRIRARHPAVYAAIMARRGELLAKRRTQDLTRERVRRHRWRRRHREEVRATVARMLARSPRQLARLLRGHVD